MKDCIYLNNAATTYPKPINVLNAVHQLLAAPPFYTLRKGFGHSSNDLVSSCRKAVADFFNADPSHHVIFTSGATEAINLAIKGLDLSHKHIITSSMEHNSVLRVLKTLEQKRKISLSIIKSNAFGCIDPEEISQHLQANTAAVVINHCSNVTGMLNDLTAIATILSTQQIPFIVDASQSAGLYPIDVKKMGIDLLIFTGHKSLYGIAGIGGLIIREGLSLNPLKEGGTGTKSNLLYQPKELPYYYEAGTPNFAGIIALQEGLNFIRQVGMGTIRKKIQQQVKQLKTFLHPFPKIHVYPQNCPYPSTLLSFSIEDLEAADVGYLLDQNYNIIVRTGLHCAPLVHAYIGAPKEGTIRVSPSYFTSPEELTIFQQAIQEILTMLS